MFLAILNKLIFFGAAGDFCNPADYKSPFFGFPHWWKYINTGEMDGYGNCTPKVPIPGGVWAIGFAIIDMLLYLAGIVAIVSIIISGVMYVTSAGNTEKATSARKRIVNSLVGLAIVLSASVVVSYIGGRIG